MNAKKYSTVIVTSLDQIPDGYVPVAEMKGQFNGNWPTVKKRISDAHAAGRIRAAKLVRTLGDLRTGRIWVHPDDAREFITDALAREEHAAKAEPQRVEEPPRTAVARESSDELLLAIKRLTAAVDDLTAAMQLRAESTFGEDAVA